MLIDSFNNVEKLKFDLLSDNESEIDSKRSEQALMATHYGLCEITLIDKNTNDKDKGKRMIICGNLVFASRSVVR